MATERRRKKPKPSALDEGDYINISISMQVPGDYESWVKTEAGTRVRSGEDHMAANERLYEAVGEMLDANIEALLE